MLVWIGPEGLLIAFPLVVVLGLVALWIVVRSATLSALREHDRRVAAGRGEETTGVVHARHEPTARP